MQLSPHAFARFLSHSRAAFNAAISALHLPRLLATLPTVRETALSAADLSRLAVAVPAHPDFGITRMILFYFELKSPPP